MEPCTPAPHADWLSRDIEPPAGPCLFGAPLCLEASLFILLQPLGLIPELSKTRRVAVSHLGGSAVRETPLNIARTITHVKAGAFLLVRAAKGCLFVHHGSVLATSPTPSGTSADPLTPQVHPTSNGHALEKRPT